MASHKSNKNIEERITSIRHDLGKYGNLSKAEIEKANFCKKLNREMRTYQDEIVKIMSHVYLTIKDTKVFKEIYKEQ